MTKDKAGAGRPRRASSPPRTLPAVAELVLAVPAAPEPAGAPAVASVSAGRGQDRSVLPAVPEGERPEAWGDTAEANDSRLLRDLPPHWGR
ncbi:MAG: hypothetical protein LBR19_05490 [Bifidobacteriaceae bacterium]|jgi:hypothetical protein|nr:hypothetical protein [Bifidobacteriaceae bacterium]